MNDELQKLLNGHVQPPPLAIPKEKTRIQLRAEEIDQIFEKGVVPALCELYNIGMDEDVGEGVRIKALSIFLDRALGKPTPAPPKEQGKDEFYERIQQARAELIASTIDVEAEEIHDS